MHPSTPTPPHFPEPRWEFTKRMELSREEHVRLKEHAESRGLLFFSSPFSVEAVELLEEIGNPLLQDRLRRGHESAAARGRCGDGQAGALSTGMAGLEDVERALAVLSDGGAGELLVLQCTSTYPAAPEQVNLRAMVAMGERFDLPYGLSDHTPDIFTSIAAVALGALGDREALHALQAALRPRSSRLADSRGAGSARRRGSRGRGRARQAGEGARPRARPGPGDLREERRQPGRDRGGHPDRAGDADHEASRQRDPAQSGFREVVGRRAARAIPANHVLGNRRPCLEGRSASSSRAAPTTRA